MVLKIYFLITHVYVCMCAYKCSTCRDQKRVMDSLELELQAVVGC